MAKSLTPVQAAAHGDMLANRVRKNLRRLRAEFARDDIDAFRVYDWDIPEVRAFVDYYAGHYVVAELQRAQTAEIDYLQYLCAGLCAGLSVPSDRVVGKQRRTRPRGGVQRYGRAGSAGERIAVREGPLRFHVNLRDYIDTGLFADHRITRARVRAQATGRRVLNLYAYTGSFSVAALAGDAAEVTSVDRSGVYLDWAADNVALNQLPSARHRAVRSETRAFLQQAAGRGQVWDLIVLDPPSYSTVGGPGGLDILRDHPQLLAETLACLAPAGQLYFSTNHQRFEPRFAGLPAQVEEISDAVQPADFRRRPHRTFVLQHRVSA